MIRRRILISAFYCSPYRGGESAVGWNVATRLAQYHDVTVLTGDVAAEQPQLKELQRWQSSHAPISGLQIVYIHPTQNCARWERWHRHPGCWSLWYHAYRLWQQSAYQRACELHRIQPFDLAHQLTMIGYREPGYLWQLPVPFVWGPMNGANAIPSAYYPSMGRSAFGPCVRDQINRIQMRISRRCRRAARTARHIWTVTRADYDMVTQLWGSSAELRIETGCTPVSGQQARCRAPEEPLRLIYSGLFVPRKGFPLLLKALHNLPSTMNWHMDVLGDGPCRVLWQSQVQKLGLTGRITWHGHLPRTQALDVMNRGHVFVHPALKEGTPHVVLEALTFGLPVICHDACGMGTAVDETCGLKVPLISPAQSVLGFTRAISSFVTDNDLLPRLSQGAIARAQTQTWDQIVQYFALKYHEIIGK